MLKIRLFLGKSLSLDNTAHVFRAV